MDSGRTLAKYDGWDHAVLHIRPERKVKYFVKETNEWVVYPWEINEQHEDEGIQDNVTRLIEYAGEDITREGLLETPRRFEKAWNFWTKGYKEDPKNVMKVFDNPGVDQLIVIPKIDFYSMCEHHLAPFYGQIHIGYIPDKKVLGLSKFARLTEIFARRLQIQERLTQQVAENINQFLKPQGVGVVVRGVHLCMRSRGIEKQNSEMVTSVMLGFFREKQSLRAEFLELIK
ncbi:MAG: GTP cyclohydrolase I FolE [Gammaproteobacteria bacterium]|nr:GTP cyclohydrolase I FolE [Gammaproteobacteria bacterium]